MKYQFTDDMDQISGFGGRAMVVAGLEWIDANPNSVPRFTSYQNIYGVIGEDNEDAKKLSEAVVAASGGDCTGAMHQAVIGHVMWIVRNGWEKYVAECIRRKAERGVAA